MEFKKVTRNPKLSRRYKANPFAGVPLIDRLIAAKTIDLRDNSWTIHCKGTGFTRTYPIDKAKVYTKESPLRHKKG